MPIQTLSHGIISTDIIVRSALIAGLQELRTQPDLIDYALCSLLHDQLTIDTYGQAEIDNARSWFLSTKIPVFSARRLDAKELPCITVTLLRSNESRNTLGDRDYEVKEFVNNKPWLTLTKPFIAEYDFTTGKVKVPDSLKTELYIVPGMYIIDDSGLALEILEVLTDSTFLIAKNQIISLKQATIKGKPPKRTINLHSAYFEEGLLIGCHVIGDQSRLLWLHSLVLFSLLRGRMTLLESRGLQVTSLGSSDIKDTDLGTEQPGFARYISISGQAMHGWVGAEADTVQSIDLDVASVSRTNSNDNEDSITILGDD